MKDKSYYRALATAFLITLGIIAWLGAIASIICSCASHKERAEVHKSDSVAVVQEHKQSSFITEITSNKEFSFDSIIYNETVVYGDSGCIETAHRQFVVRGFHATSIDHTTSKEDSTSSKQSMTESHRRDSVKSLTKTTAIAKPVGMSFFDYILIIAVIIFFSYLYVKRNTKAQ